jgi:hypothetical protein
VAPALSAVEVLAPAQELEQAVAAETAVLAMALLAHLRSAYVFLLRSP